VRPFQGPDGIQTLWVDFGGTRRLLKGREVGTASDVGLDGRYETGSATTIHVNPTTGSDSLYTGRVASLPKATIAGALAAIGTGVDGHIELALGVHDVGNGCSLNGYKVTIRGRGAGHLDTSGGIATRTVIRATTQTGPVLDFTGYVCPTSFAGKVSFGDFAIEGSGVADATKNNAGIRLGVGGAIGSLYLHDIVVGKTGGPAYDIGFAYLCDFERLVALTPVSAGANDVPFFQIAGANGNRFLGLGCRTLSGNTDGVGPSGAIVVKPNGTNSPTANEFIAPWFEFLQVPTNGCLISSSGNANRWIGVQGFDSSKQSGATGTAFARFLAPTGGAVDSGLNHWNGVVPGNGGTATSFDVGIEMGQSRNGVIGPKGYKGTNVQIDSGVTNTYVLFTGAESSATNAAVVDNSGNVTNVYNDPYSDLDTRTNYSVTSRTTASANAAGPQFMDRGNNANGGLWLGNAGMGMRATGSGGIVVTDSITFRQVSGATTMQFVIDNSFRPGIIFSSHGGSLPGASSSIRSKMSVMQGATGVADHLWLVRKKNDDTYEWTQLDTTNLVTKTASYTLLSTDNIAVFNGTSLTATLPDPTTVPVGQAYRVKNVNSSALTVASAGTTKTLDGAASQSLAQWANARYVSDGTQWLTV
jgi:hypothetical protein